MADDYEAASLEQAAEGAQSSSSTAKTAVALYIAGASFDDIAKRCEYSSPQTARTAVETIIGNSYTATDSAAARNKLRARYERMFQAVWPDAVAPFEVDEKGQRTKKRNEAHGAAFDRSRALLGDMARLDGLNAPTQLAVYTPTSDEMMDLVQELLHARRAELPAEGDPFAEEAEFEEFDKDGKLIDASE